MDLELNADFFLSALQSPTTAIRLTLEHELTKYADKHVVVGTSNLKLGLYEKLELCKRTRCEVPRPIFDRYWGALATEPNRPAPRRT